ncbi:MAG: L-2-hydroxyglutarate oxidase [Armatimonadota bacterium]|nr:L-2-hydroxyglutarate oxidase [Armatimonadota bacterium]
MHTSIYDVAIVGGGIVGLATTMALVARRPDLRVVVLEKEREPGMHQTGHNSGVLHSGIYYRPGSAKARLCVEGARLMRAFCAEHGVRVVDRGKVIVATDEAELPRLNELYRRGVANGVQGLAMIGPERLRELEPHAAGIRAIHAPHTASLDYGAVAQAMAAVAGRHGVTLLTGAPVGAVMRRRDAVVLRAGAAEVQSRYLVNCAGLYSDIVARLAGAVPDVRIVPFRGEYYMLRPERRDLVRGLIYPVPDPEFPFLGVHFTRTVHGDVEAGPNAVLAFAREGYSWRRVRPCELAGTLTYPGFWRMARRYWRTGLYEVWRSLSKAEFVRALRRLVPALRPDDVTRGGAGVRAQAVAPDGSLIDDFRIVESPRMIHVLNAPSPAATASLAIGRHIAELVLSSIGPGGGQTA